MGRREIPFTDLGGDAEAIVEARGCRGGVSRRKGKKKWGKVYRKPAPAIWQIDTVPWVHLDGLNPWEAWEHISAAAGYCPCPVCHDGPLKDMAYCDACDRTGQDDRMGDKYPFVPVGAALEVVDKTLRKYLVQPSYEGGELKGGK